ncbi:MAG: TraR/DksA family transcriptional regulator [Cytophagales bacterium]|nr:TraR/DksA family transcriptional regulator [Cytophagales bacterium]
MKKADQKKYSLKELKEFEKIILKKLVRAKGELKFIKEALSRKNDNRTEMSIKMLEDSVDTAEKENLSQLAARQQKFIAQLESALVRIKNGTYGICVDTGNLIRKERLKAVPHTMHSIAAKLNKGL